MRESENSKKCLDILNDLLYNYDKVLGIALPTY